MSPATQICQVQKIDHEKQSTEPPGPVLITAFTFKINVLFPIIAIIQWSVALYGSLVACLRSRDNDNIGASIFHHPESPGI